MASGAEERTVEVCDTIIDANAYVLAYSIPAR